MGLDEIERQLLALWALRYDSRGSHHELLTESTLAGAYGLPHGFEACMEQPN